MSDVTPDSAFVVQPVSIEELRARYPERAGADHLIPNSLRIMARDPELAEAMGKLAYTVAFRPGTVDRGLKWLVGHMASRASGCRYCTAHSVNYASHDGVSDERVEAVWSFETSPLFTDAERVALRWARAAGSVPNEVTREQYDELHEHFDDDQIVEMASIICLYGWFNRWNDMFHTPLEEEPLAYAEAHIAQTGWDAGRHVPEA